jgi:chromosome segregation ATPase
MSRNPQEQSISLSVEHALEDVRVAMLANKHRVQHETSVITQKYEAEIAELQRTIDDKIRSIAEHDRSNQTLRDALSQLTDKAKNNQRFVTGLQQDYEKLQKSTTDFQRQSAKTLIEKISELEDEKKALQGEFLAITDKLATTQRKMRSMLDDVYVRYIISESKRNDLAESLGRQDAVLKEERKKRDKMEKQLLSGVQGIPRQVVDISDALTKKLELLQASLDNATAHDTRNSQIKECLDALQTLPLTPALTMQDIEKMESTLRLVHERYVVAIPFLHVSTY